MRSIFTLFGQMIIFMIKFLLYNHNLLDTLGLNLVKLHVYRLKTINYHQFSMVQPNKRNAHKYSVCYSSLLAFKHL